MLTFPQNSEGFMETIEINNFSPLASGANTTQNAYISNNESIEYEIISRNKELEYIDYLNLSEAVKILGEFFDVNCAVITKGSYICSVALGATSDEAFSKAMDCDPLSVNNSTVGISKEVTLENAKQFKLMKVRNIIAPLFSKEAFSCLLDSDINMIAVKTPLHELQGFSAKDIKVTPFGILVQEQNNSKLTKDTFKVVSQIKPTQEQVEDAIFGWKISKHLKTQSAVIAKDLSTRGIIQGKSNSIIAAESVMDIACEYSKDAVLILDGVIDNTEIVNTAIQGRIGLIIDAGDGKNSANILKYADKYGISMIFTNCRNNRY